MAAYYNEIDPYAAQWLRNLIAAGHIAPGDVDERSIVDVLAADLCGYEQCHFFAGIGGWSYALRLAGWPDDRPVWTGSCPCQPFSEAGKQLGFSDSRDLWPDWFSLIGQRRPAIVFGEQVASKIGVVWADRTASDLEGADYAFGTAILSAACVGAPHRRDRFYFAAHAIGADARGRDADRRWQPLSAAVARPWDHPVIGNGSLDDGLPAGVAKAIANGFGNAIVPKLAAEFIRAAS
jgi:DNA (cytosine-5)-methyltransferase 1